MFTYKLKFLIFQQQKIKTYFFENVDFLKNVMFSKTMFFVITRERFWGLANDSEDSRTVLSTRERYLWTDLSRIENIFWEFSPTNLNFDFSTTKKSKHIFSKMLIFPDFSKMLFFRKMWFFLKQLKKEVSGLRISPRSTIISQVWAHTLSRKYAQPFFIVMKRLGHKKRLLCALSDATSWILESKNQCFSDFFEKS